MKPTFVRATALLQCIFGSPIARLSVISIFGNSAEAPTFTGPANTILFLIATSGLNPVRMMAMVRKVFYKASARSLLCLLMFGWLSVQLPAKVEPLNPQARTQSGKSLGIRIALNVINGSLPVCIGVPISEAANVSDASQLSVIDADGNSVPSQTRVLARWGGVASQTNKPIKWLLVDFKPAIAGQHYLINAVHTINRLVSVNESENIIRVSNFHLDVAISKQGESLLKDFKLGGNEMLRAPMQAQMSLPRRVLVNQTGPSADQVTVTDTALLRVGDEVRFEHVDSLKWDASAGSARLVTIDQSFAANRRYLINEGTSAEEEVTVSSAQPGDLRTDKPLRFSHPAGTTIRDLSIEQERAVIKGINGQLVEFASALKTQHAAGEKMVVVGAKDETAVSIVEKTTVEEANALRVVIRQEGVFRAAGRQVPPTLAFTIRYYVYADQPFVRIRLRLMNNGAYGFGAYRSGPSPFAQHALLRQLSVLMPTVSSGNGTVQVLKSDDARHRIGQRQSGASLAAGRFEIAVPEFVENFPKALQGDKNGLRFDILPDTGSDYVFDGARAKTTDFYIGRETIAARVLTSSTNATLNPAYIAQTGAVRPAFVERRDWPSVFKQDREMGESAQRTEKLFASAYAVEASEASGSIPAQSIFEYRQRGEQGEQFGWRNFGDLAWGDGYANVHYDLPFVLLREYLRSGDSRAFQLGSEMARYRADWGQCRSDDYLNENWNLRGMAFYEKGDHGSFREPVPSHSWIEGMWLYWALTGDETARESALEGSEAFARINFNYDNALSWNEPRWLGWPILGLVVAYRYTGDVRYLDKARENVNLMLKTEEAYGRKGFYIGKGMNAIQAVQPWAWSYAQLGVIEYWRETGDARTADYLVRLADWMISKGSDNPPLKPGVILSDGNYLPAGMSYYWYPDKISEDRSVALGGLALPVLAIAARISNRDDLRERAKQLFRDYAFYRDLPEGRPVIPSARAVINFRSVLFAASATKVYGQMGLTIADYLPEITDSVVRPTVQAIGTIPRRDQSESPPSVPPINTDTLINVALNRPATASSTRLWPDIIGLPSAANDGQTNVSGKVSIWHSDSNTGKQEWWQVDLGQSYGIQLIEIIFRADRDQPLTRRNLEVRGSNTPDFSNSRLLASRGEETIPFQQTWRATVMDKGAYRYVRVQKTSIDRDQFGQAFFNLGEVRLWAQPFQETSAPEQTGSPDYPLMTPAQLKSQKLLVGQTLRFRLALENQAGQPILYKAYNLPENSKFDHSTGEFWFTPDSQQAGNVFQISFLGTNHQQVDSFVRMDVAVVIDGAPDIALLSPTLNTRITTDQPVLIGWSALQSAQIAKYQIRLSMDGGASYPVTIADLPGSANQYQWLVPRNFPATSRSSLRLMIKATDAKNRVGIDYSTHDLRISIGSPQR